MSQDDLEKRFRESIKKINEEHEKRVSELLQTFEEELLRLRNNDLDLEQMKNTSEKISDAEEENDRNGNAELEKEPEKEEKPEEQEEEKESKKDRIRRESLESAELFYRNNLADKYRYPTLGNDALYSLNEKIRTSRSQKDPEISKPDVESAISAFRAEPFFNGWNIKTERDGTYKDTGIAVWKTTITDSQGDEVTHGYSVEDPLPKDSVDTILGQDMFYDNVTERSRPNPDSVLMALQNLGIGLPNNRKMLEASYGEKGTALKPMGIRKLFFEKNGMTSAGPAVLDIERTDGPFNFRITSKIYNIDYDRDTSESKFKISSESYGDGEWSLDIPEKKQTETRKTKSFFTIFNKKMDEIYKKDGFNLAERQKNTTYEQVKATEMDIINLKDSKGEETQHRNEDEYGLYIPVMEKEERDSAEKAPAERGGILGDTPSPDNSLAVYQITVGGREDVPIKGHDRDMLSMMKSILSKVGKNGGIGRYQTLHEYCEKNGIKSFDLTDEHIKTNIEENRKILADTLRQMAKKGKETKINCNTMRQYPLVDPENSAKELKEMIAWDLDSKTEIKASGRNLAIKTNMNARNLANEM